MAEPIKLGNANSMALDAENDVVYWRGTLPFPDDAERGIHRLDLADGSDTILFDGIERSGIGLALDLVSDHLYWSDQGGIWRSDLDGNDIQLIIPDAGNVASIVVAPVPEPGTLVLALMAIGLGWLAGSRLLRRSRC
jgi:hypothetical protein